ncbi:thiopeptide-type bacteriocin biosynthesis protein [Saccharothrix ecbatanensis]|uniref:Thiopeptide-type bacteriocin biosynthesis protein n=1 Tax=Saccharothrix ecbatanensis TaxID=1105145 RepID=A0A7W9HGY9_9PSEU|nr:thiopeptide-type bacteriocin biosynthesis protein [Saccharothrix ecbatanensis]MBB5802069.1 thiopeptide-type bacteriocin biosynthesis protein [Saccharothrix ecbatanensis]
MTWTSLHVRLSWAVEDVDAFIADVLAPELDGHRAAGRVADWFYVRYWEAGPHLRVRVRDAAVDLADRLRSLVAGADRPVVVSSPDWLPHGDVREMPYVPEVERYGGPESLPVAEAVFCRSTEVAVAVLRSAGSKFTAAVELVMATTIAVKLDRVEAASWLRSLATGWRQAREPVAPPGMRSHIAARTLHEARATHLAARWDRLESRATGAVGYWADQVRAVDLPRYVWASQLHMLFNRLGLGPEEERTVCRLVAMTAEAPDGPTPFHEDGATAADRRYLAASKFHSGVPDQGPLKVEVTSPTLPWWPDVPLPDAAPVSGALADALLARHTARGPELSGPLDARQLATLLWTAQGALPDGRRPYPSAGARHSARLRVVALRVTGLEPGVYEVDEVRRTLVHVAPAPPVDDVRASSMWFGEGEGRVDPATTPAVLALYTRIGELRAAYGLRALRLAFTEAGHLAQNLALVAASSGLALGMIGGFYDDMAHDVLCLDGVDDTLVYLMPLASV